MLPQEICWQHVQCSSVLLACPVVYRSAGPICRNRICLISSNDPVNDFEVSEKSFRSRLEINGLLLYILYG